MPATAAASRRPALAQAVLRQTGMLARGTAVRLVGFGVLLAIWAAASTQFLAVQLPRPGLVLDAVQTNFSTAPSLALQGLEGGYLSNVGYSATNAILAFLLGGLAGFAVGTSSARLQWVRNLSAPLLLLFGTVPDLVAAPFLLIWLGPGQAAQFVIVSFYCFVVIGIAAQNATLRLEPHYEAYGATLGASARRRFFTIVLPAAIPSIIGAARVALATAWSLQCAGELLGSQEGVGRVVVLSQQLGDTAGTIGVISVLAMLALLADAILTTLLRATCRWQSSLG